MIDDQYRIQYISGSCFGQAVDALLGKFYLDEIAPEDRPIVEQAVARVLRTKTPATFESRGCGADSETAWYRTHVLPLPADQGAQRVLLLNDHTLNIGRFDEWTGRQMCDLLFSVLASTEDEVWFTDLQGQFTLFNPAAQQTFGLAVEPPVKVETVDNAVEVFNPDGTLRPPDQAPPLRLLRGEAIDFAEEILRLPATGELRYRQLSISWVRDQAGEAIGVVSVVRDITKLKQFATESLDLLHRTKDVISLIEQAVAANPSTHHGESPSPGAVQLTARQCEILGLLAEGLTMAEIAKRLFISTETVRTHRRNLLIKLGLRNKAELIRYAIEHKMIKGRRKGDSP